MPRRGGFLRLVVISLFVTVAVGGVLIGPRVAADAARGGVLAAAKRKLKALHDYALFRAKGDRAVVHFDDPAKTRTTKPSRP